MAKETKSKKVENYTDAQAAELKTAFVAAETDEARAAVVAQFAEKFGKTDRSIRAKLTSMKVYRKPEKVSKSGGEIISKDDLRTRIQAQAEELGYNGAHFETLTACSKVCMQAVQSLLAEIENDRKTFDEMNGGDDQLEAATA